MRFWKHSLEDRENLSPVLMHSPQSLSTCPGKPWKEPTEGRRLPGSLLRGEELLSLPLRHRVAGYLE